MTTTTERLARKYARRDVEAKARAISHMLTDPDCRRYFALLLAETENPVYGDTAVNIAFAAGRRSVLTEIQNELRLADLDNYHLMEKEHTNVRNTRAGNLGASIRADEPVDYQSDAGAAEPSGYEFFPGDDDY